MENIDVMKKRKIALFVAVAVLAIGLASCAGQKKKYRFGGCRMSTACASSSAPLSVA